MIDLFLSVFLREEVTPYVKKLLCSKINNRTTMIIDKIGLNKYDITIDFEKNTVLIEEITFIEFAEVREMSISEFLEMLKC
ncbi:hypothetical protein [Ancylobacter sp.]|uniref:hypothetical protein n=1 Tax=Ancylobacter sp. TaxID=1872567 RepID=UPI003D0E4B0A